MAFEIQDDRTAEQKQTHNWLVVGTDSFLSGWGSAKGGVSLAAWACTFEDYEPALASIRRRSDMKRVRVVFDRNKPYRPRGNGHLHIYIYKGQQF